jgi:NADH-quinone oxidoreductase subunit M
MLGIVKRIRNEAWLFVSESLVIIVGEIRNMDRINSVVSFVLIFLHLLLICSGFALPFLVLIKRETLYFFKSKIPDFEWVNWYIKRIDVDKLIDEDSQLYNSKLMDGSVFVRGSNEPFTHDFNGVFGSFFFIEDGILNCIYKHAYCRFYAFSSQLMDDMLYYVGRSNIFFLEGQFDMFHIKTLHIQKDSGCVMIPLLLDDLLSLMFIMLVFLVFSSVWCYALWFNVCLLEVSIYFVIEVLSLIVFISKTLLTLIMLMEISTVVLLFVFIGNRARRVRAMSLLFVYTFISGSCLLVLYVYSVTGLIDNFFVFLVGLVGFFIKLPVFPFHYWLPEAHSECTTCGSVILAGVILKIGYYGFLKYMLPFVTNFSSTIRGVLIGFLMLSVVYIFGAVMMQTDVKKIIAYSSVIHMQLATAMLFFIDDLALISSLLLVLNHAFVSSSLFFLASLYINIEGTRDIIKWRGSKRHLSGVLLFLILCNIGFPFTIGFYGELIVVVVCSNTTFIIIFLLLIIQVIAVSYNLRMYWLIMANDGPYYNIKKDTLVYLTPIVILMVFNITLFIFFSYCDFIYYIENYKVFFAEILELNVLLEPHQIPFFTDEILTVHEERKNYLDNGVRKYYAALRNKYKNKC